MSSLPFLHLKTFFPRKILFHCNSLDLKFILGSIRAPALFNGIFGLKPGPGLTNMTGFIPEDVHGYQGNSSFLKLEFIILFFS